MCQLLDFNILKWKTQTDIEIEKKLFLFKFPLKDPLWPSSHFLAFVVFYNTLHIFFFSKYFSFFNNKILNYGNEEISTFVCVCISSHVVVHNNEMRVFRSICECAYVSLHLYFCFQYDRFFLFFFYCCCWH